MPDVPTGAAKAAARDKYYVYRPLLDLIGYTEGTDKGDGYNETLAYGKFTGGNVNLVGMTLKEVDALQTKMLRHPDNSFNSSAIGRYQIVRTTLRDIRKKLDLSASALFDQDMQDRCACYLLGLRGIDKYLAGRLSEDTLINNLAQEWASLPTTAGTGAYSGQRAAVTVDRVRNVLAAVRARHMAGQPVKKVRVPVEKPVVPEKVEQKVKEKTGFWGWLTTILGSSGAGLAGLFGASWQTILALGAVAIVGVVILVVLGPQIVKAIGRIREAVEAT